MCFNIEEHIYGFIIVTLILIILIGCSIYLHKKKNIASNTILSIWSISLSAIAIIVTMVRVDVYFTNDSFVGIMAGFMGACATILVGVQIYNSIDTRNSINKMNELFNSKIETINNLQTNINKDIEYLKEERERSDHFTMYGVEFAIGISNMNNDPIGSFNIYFDALLDAMILNNPTYIDNVLFQLEVVRDVIISKNITLKNKSISKEKIKQIKQYRNSPLILKRLNSILKSLEMKEI